MKKSNKQLIDEVTKAYNDAKQDRDQYIYTDFKWHYYDGIMRAYASVLFTLTGAWLG